ncbi:MAG: triose-phosphate isomerase [Planctomycetes bacterium]|nr:triose-phosphate isomerase [Planctomycetota bacterium]
MRKPFMAGNWKMNLSVEEGVSLALGIKDAVGDYDAVDVAVAPVSVVLPAVAQALKGSRIIVGAQNIHWEQKGAFTGEVSAEILASAGASMVIIGHSERRQFFGETNETVQKKLLAAHRAGLHPIVCVGEQLSERESGRTQAVVRGHVQGAFAAVDRALALKTTVAYEPVWAIGTGVTATPDQAQEVHAFIRTLLADLYDDDLAQTVRIQYGGSVKPDNVKGLMQQPDIDGALVGGASLKVDSFAAIVKFNG